MSQNKVIFLSDIHLGMGNKEQDKIRERFFVDFLKSNLNKNDRLFIVGDLFDFWFEYKTVIPKGHLLTLATLQELCDSGIKIDYIAGNHDFWVGQYFKEELGIEFHSEPLSVALDEKKFFIIHGDGLKKNDSAYRVLKSVFRNKLNIFLYRWLHPDIGVPLAKWCSQSSRDHTANKDYGDEGEYVDFAENKVKEGFDHVIMGHTHKPLEKVFGDGKSLINTGDWIHNFSYAKFENNKLTLESAKQKKGDG